MHRLPARILDVSNAFQNTNFPIHEIVCVIPPPYYLNLSEISYPNGPINRYDGPFCFQCMNGIQGIETSGRQQNIFLDAVVTILKYKNSIVYHDIYIKVFTDGTVSYLTFSTDDVLNTINNQTAFTEPTIVFKEHFDVKLQQVSVLKYLNFRIFQYPLGFSVDQTDHIMELVNEWFPTVNFRKVDTHFRIDSAYEKVING